MKLWNWLRRKRPRQVSVHDFTITVDTKASGGDRLVLHWARKREATLHMQVTPTQFMWLLDDPDEFARAYAARAQWADPYAQPTQRPAVEVTA